MLELLCNTINLFGKGEAAGISKSDFFTHLLEFFDGVCWLMKGRPKPSNWVACLLKTAKLFTMETRVAAITSHGVSFGPRPLCVCVCVCAH